MNGEEGRNWTAGPWAVGASQEAIEWAVDTVTSLPQASAIGYLRAAFSGMADRPRFTGMQPHLQCMDEAVVIGFGNRLSEKWRVVVVALPAETDSGYVLLASTVNVTLVDGIVPGLETLVQVQRHVSRTLAMMPKPAGQAGPEEPAGPREPAGSYPPPPPPPPAA